MHASNTLEEMVLAAISLGFRSYALTEHMPRDLDEDLYPEEVGRFVSYSSKANSLRLQSK